MRETRKKKKKKSKVYTIPIIFISLIFSLNRVSKGTFGLGFPEDEEEIDEIEEYPEYEEIEVDEADADILSKFFPSAPREKKSLADIIMEKINEKNAAEGLPAIGMYRQRKEKEKLLIFLQSYRGRRTINAFYESKGCRSLYKVRIISVRKEEMIYTI